MAASSSDPCEDEVVDRIKRVSVKHPIHIDGEICLQHLKSWIEFWRCCADTIR